VIDKETLFFAYIHFSHEPQSTVM